MAHIGNAPPSFFTAVSSDVFSANGTATSFSLSKSISNLADLELVVDNIQQNPFGGSYSVSGSTLTFSEAPAAGSNNVVVTYRQATIGSTIPTPNTVGNNSLQSNLSLTGTTTTQHIVPSANITYDLGTSTMRYRDLYLSGGTITLGDVTLTTNGSTFSVANTTGGVLPSALGNTTVTGTLTTSNNVSVGNSTVNTSITSTSLTTGNLTVNGNTTLGDASTDTILMTGAPSIGGAGLGMGMGFRNRIINGAMVIDQRNAGASVAVTTADTYVTDRFAPHIFGSGTGRFTAQQVSTVPTGFAKSLQLTVTTTDASPAAGYGYCIQQRIEGYNVADLLFGSASAQTVTLSFWVRSSVTGSFGFLLNNGSVTRNYGVLYTISAANTWEQKTITIAGDTTGTWETTNLNGLGVTFCLGGGSTRTVSTGWNANVTGTTPSFVTGGTNLMATNGATFYITGVQLEKGSTATSFDYRPYGTELALCQRYYWKAVNGTNQHMAGTAYYFSATEINMAISCPMPMRATPTLEQVTGTDFYFFTGVTDFFDGWTGLQLSSPTTNPTQINLYVTSGVSGTSGRAGGIRTNNASSSVAFTAEL